MSSAATLRDGGELVLWRRPGRGIFFGRHGRLTVISLEVAKVRISIEAPVSIAVSGPPRSLEEHLAIQQDRESAPTDATVQDLTPFDLEVGQKVWVGRSVVIEYVGPHGRSAAAFEFQAPENCAITRDDYSHEEHLEKQARRDASRRSDL
jgi:sRNA-binding carbon storage regulator CsrA